MTDQHANSGHRARLRAHFLADPASLSDVQLLELLISFAIPRRDVAPQAAALLERFGSLGGVLRAPWQELLAVDGIGEQVGVLLRLVEQIGKESSDMEPIQQPLFDTAVEEPQAEEPPEVTRELRIPANDEIENTLRVLPEASQFPSYEAFKEHLQRTLPYNSEITRNRRANYILNRFFPAKTLHTPLAYYASRVGLDDLKPAVFYEFLKAEPLIARVAEEVVWPHLPMGMVERETLREGLLKYLPDMSKSSQQNALRSLFHVYTILSVAQDAEDALRLQVHSGTTAGFLYVLTAEFPEPGMYAFELLEQGPMRQWLLWDRQWMYSQLYALREAGIIAKVSEIDNIRQFTLSHTRLEALRRFFS